MRQGRIALWTVVGLSILIVAGLFGANFFYSRRDPVDRRRSWCAMASRAASWRRNSPSRARRS